MKHQEPQAADGPTEPGWYRRKLVWLLWVATFFEGYDTVVISLVLALILGDLGGSEAEAGGIRAVVGVGSVLGFFLAAQADRSVGAGSS
jgi:MFS family permease